MSPGRGPRPVVHRIFRCWDIWWGVFPPFNFDPVCNPAPPPSPNPQTGHLGPLRQYTRKKGGYRMGNPSADKPKKNIGTGRNHLPFLEICGKAKTQVKLIISLAPRPRANLQPSPLGSPPPHQIVSPVGVESLGGWSACKKGIRKEGAHRLAAAWPRTSASAAAFAAGSPHRGRFCTRSSS